MVADGDLDPGIIILFANDTELDAVIRAGKDKFEELLDCFQDVMSSLGKAGMGITNSWPFPGGVWRVRTNPPQQKKVHFYTRLLHDFSNRAIAQFSTNCQTCNLVSIAYYYKSWVIKIIIRSGDIGGGGGGGGQGGSGTPTFATRIILCKWD